MNRKFVRKCWPVGMESAAVWGVFFWLCEATLRRPLDWALGEKDEEEETRRRKMRGTLVIKRILEKHSKSAGRRFTPKF